MEFLKFEDNGKIWKIPAGATSLEIECIGGGGKNPFSELYLLTYVWRLLWRLRPDVLHLVTIKPVIYGGIAARLAPVVAMARNLPDLMWGKADGMLSNIACTWPPSKSVMAGALPL